MKRWLCVCLLLSPWLLALAVNLNAQLHYDNPRVASALPATFQSSFWEIGTLSTANGDPATTARSYASLAAVADTALFLWEVPDGANAVCLRFRIGADADTATVRVLTLRDRANPGDYGDDGSLAYQWVLVGGSMTATLGGVYCDTGTATAYALAGGSANTVQANWIYEYEFDLAGVAYLAFYRTDAEDVSVDIDVAVY